MNNKQFQKMIALFLKLDKLIKKYEKEFMPESDISDEPIPIMFPDDVYDEICDKLKIKELGVIGIS